MQFYGIKEYLKDEQAKSPDPENFDEQKALDRLIKGNEQKGPGEVIKSTYSPRSKMIEPASGFVD